MSRGVYRGVHSSLFDDPDFQHLSARARHVLLTARLCRDAGPAVIFRYYPEVLARQTGLTLPALETALQELERTRWVYREGVVLWVRNGLRHDPQVRLNSSKHRSAVIRQLEGLPKVGLLATFCDYYRIDKATAGLSIGYPAMASDTESDTPRKTDTPNPSPKPSSVVSGEPASNGAQPDPEIVITPDEERGLPIIAQARRITLAQARSELLTAKLREREGRSR